MAAPTRAVPVPVQLENIPEALRKDRRWVVWLPKWDGEKFGKKPGRIDRPGVGLTNWAAEGWVDFDTAAAAYMAHPHIYGGIGYVMSKSPGVTGVDLDNCIDAAGNVAPWAAQIVKDLNSYTEVSPSGRGLRAFVQGDLADWQTPRTGEVQMEVYGGSGGRFLTVTGAMFGAAPRTVNPAPAGVLAALKTKYYRESPASSVVEDLHIPAVLPECMLPDIDPTELPAHVRNFLSDGPTGNDHSAQLFAAAIGLTQYGLDRDQVFSVLANNEFALEIAERHWSGNADKALRYLWKHSAQKGAARAEDFKQAKFDEFDDMGVDLGKVQDEVAARPAPQVPDIADDFDDLGPSEQREVATPAPAKKAKRSRFAPETAVQFLQHQAPKWIIKKVLPRAGLAVIYGNSDAGKTFFTLDLVAAVARGVEWRGARVEKGRVLYVVAEGAGGFRNRLQAYCDSQGVEPDQFNMCFLRQAPNLLTKDDIREFLEQVVPLGRFDVIVIDTYARAMAGGNENDAKDVGQAVAHCEILHRKTGALVVLVHHSGKDASKGARGSGALRAAADMEIEVVRTREYRAATVTKQKDGADGAEYQFKLAEVVLGEDEDGEPITSCVVEHTNDPVRRDPGLKGNQATVMAAITAVIDLAGEITYSDALEAGVSQLPQDPEKRDRRRDVVTAAIQTLESKGLLRLENGQVHLQ